MKVNVGGLDRILRIVVGLPHKVQSDRTVHTSGNKRRNLHTEVRKIGPGGTEKKKALRPAGQMFRP